MPCSTEEFTWATDEYKGCENCRYEDKEILDEPCVNCRNNYVAGTLGYKTHELLWESPNNQVSHPSHYNQGGIECLDAMEAAYGKEATATFCLTNAFKYLWRTEHKNGLQDIDKAIWYLNKYKELKSND